MKIDDLYKVQGLDFYGIKRFDKMMNYQSQSLLVIPLFDENNQVCGVVQLNSTVFSRIWVGFGPSVAILWRPVAVCYPK